MSRSLKLVFVMIGLVCIPGQFALAQAIKSPPTVSLLKPPALRLPDIAHPTAYRVRLELDPQKDTFDAVININLSVASATPILWLNATALDIHSATLAIGGEHYEASVVPGGDNFAGFRFERPIGPGEGDLRIEYSGKVDATATSGLFHQQEKGDWYLFSDFEPTDARRVFPSFDEPSYKVPWQLTLDVPADLVAVTNTPEASSEDLGEGRKRIEFAPTKPLPSYLIALAVGPFDVVDVGTAGKNHVPLRIFAMHGTADQTRFSKTIMPEALNRLEAYFGIPYPYAKLDAVAIPQTVSFGAMENAGMITYVANSILASPSEESVSFKRRAADYIVHETSHQWFGDLVTMAWWNDLWLNESFASWMEDRILSDWFPEWDRDVHQVAVRDRALGGDLLPSARKIRQPITSLDDIQNAFDGVTYGKGASIIQMFEAWMGPENFRKGVHQYLLAHRFGNATAEDFLAALGAEGPEGTAEAFATFINQVGAPELRVELNCETGQTPSLTFEQSRLHALGVPKTEDSVWKIPVCVRYGDGDAVHRQCTLVDEMKARLPLSDAACPSWVEANDHSLGYYRSIYSKNLRAALLDKGLGELSVAEEVGFLGDERALSVTGQVPMGDALALVPVFADRPAWQLTATSAAIAGSVSEHLVSDELRPNYERFIRQMFGARARELGFEGRPTESDDTRLLRGAIVGLVAVDGEDPGLIAEAKRLAAAWLDDHSVVSADMAGTVLRVAARNGDDALFDRFLQAVKKEPERRDRARLYSALGQFREPKLLARALNLLLDPEMDLREGGTILRAAISENATRQQAWDFFTQHFDDLWKRSPREYAPYLPYYGAGFCDSEHQKVVKEFFAPRLGELTGAGRTLAQVEEIIGICAANRAAQEPSVDKFLTAY